jgi:excisionase family DNA binding protein
MTVYDRTGSSPAFMTTDEVLSYLRVNARTVYRLVKSGQLPAHRIGRELRFFASDLEAWLVRHRIGGPEETTTTTKEQ